MWPSRDQERLRIVVALRNYDTNTMRLRGLVDSQTLEALSLQFIASLRREDFYKVIQERQPEANRANPNDPSFDAERAVAYHMQVGNLDEAAWLIFLMTHFAKPTDSGWLRLTDVYGRLGAGIWDWATVSANPAAFAAWIAGNWGDIRGKFGNHRKYESLRPDCRRNIGLVVAEYVDWIGGGGHAEFFATMVRQAGNNPHTVFDALYRDMRVTSFGRLAKFDYLALIGRYGLAPISPGSAYLRGATGPLYGAKLLFDGRRDSASSEFDLQRRLDALDADLRVGMIVMEDALCNWQKSPSRFVHYKG